MLRASSVGGWGTSVAQSKSVGPALVVLVCFLVAAVEGYDIQAFGVAAPAMAPELGLDAGQLGWAGAAAMIGLVTGAFAGGWLADRFGRKPVLLGSVAAFGLFSLATAASPSYEALLAARLATGLGFGGAMPNLIAVASEISRPDRRAATVTAMFCGMPAGGATSALIARVLGAELDWRTIFVAGGIVPLVLIPLIAAALPETRPAHDPASERRLTVTLFGGGRATATLTLWAAFVLTLMVLYLALNWLPTLIVANGRPPSEGFAAAMVFNIAGIVGSLVLGVVTDRLGWRWPLFLAYLGLGAAMAGLAKATDTAAVLACVAAAGFLVMGAQFALYAVAPRLYPLHARAAGAGAAVAMGRLGSIIGPLAAGELRTLGWSPGEVFAAMTPVALAAAAALYGLGRVGRMEDDNAGAPMR
jgi:AAHS family 3-hydroxyphenylpropionic acid transporter